MERFNRAIRQFERETILNRINELELKDGLDVGCGNNKIMGTGVDNDDSCNPDILAEMHTIDEYITPDNNVLKFIIACHSLEHTDYVIDTLRVFHKLLMNEGKLFICVPDGNWVSSKDLGDGDMTHRQIFTIMTLTKLVEYCGFKVDVCKLIEKNSLYLEATK